MKKIWLGAHTSASGGAHNALYEGQQIGATTIQLFTSNQKQWHGRHISKEDIELWQKALAETGIEKVMSHDSYLINLGSPKEDILSKSRKAFKEELKRCHLFDITFLNFHPGAATDKDVDRCLETIAESLLELEELVAQGNTKIVLETTAGQGTCVGHNFNQIGQIINRVKTKIPIGVCIDTCHIFAAGYDIRTKQGWDETFQEFDREIGLKHLVAFHLNDSVKDLGSRVDRHAPLGMGKIGMESFKYLMQHTDQPKYLETPDGPSLWKQEIAILRKYAQEKN